jgi:hypothetical protein
MLFQYRRRRVCPSQRDAGASAQIAFGSYERRAIQTERQRSMPTYTALLAIALVCRCIRLWSGFLAAAALALMLISTQRQLVMPRLHSSRTCPSHRSAGSFCPGCGCSAIGYAHPVRALAWCALIGCRVRSRSRRAAEQALAADAVPGERDRGDFDTQFLLQWHHDLSVRRG